MCNRFNNRLVEHFSPGPWAIYVLLKYLSSSSSLAQCLLFLIETCSKRCASPSPPSLVGLCDYRLHFLLSRRSRAVMTMFWGLIWDTLTWVFGAHDMTITSCWKTRMPQKSTFAVQIYYGWFADLSSQNNSIVAASLFTELARWFWLFKKSSKRLDLI